MNTEMNNETIITVVSPLEVCITCKTELVSAIQTNTLEVELFTKLHVSCCENFLKKVGEKVEEKIRQDAPETRFMTPSGEVRCRSLCGGSGAGGWAELEAHASIQAHKDNQELKRQEKEAFEAKRAKELEEEAIGKRKAMEKHIIVMFDTQELSVEERIIACSKGIEKEAKEGIKILGKKNAKIEKDRAKLDEIEERQRVALARKQKERREAFEAKNQASLKETEDIVAEMIAVWENVKEQYEDTGPMLK
tara:strand:- start:212 stop:961 length:750 start_codon:yes stop_codon:yes gene_type:complete